MVTLLTAYLLVLLLRHEAGYSLALDGVLGNAVLAVPALVCLVRAGLDPARRVPFALIGLAAAAFTAGNVEYVVHVQFLDPVPYPSPADIGYLLPYPLLLAAVLVLARPQLAALPAGSVLDGVLGVLSTAAAGSVIATRPVLESLQGSGAALVVGAAYPVADLTLFALIVGIVIIQGGRPGATWCWLGSGVVVFAVADTLYLNRIAAGTYVVGTPLDALWAVGLTLMAVAAALPYRPTEVREAQPSQALLLPNVFSLVGIGVLISGSLSRHRLPLYAVVLVGLTLLTAVKRTAIGFSALRELSESRRQARTDELTQLPNRRYFDEEAQRALTERAPDEPAAVVMLDINGFKAINDTFGHHAGDELLRQIGPRLRQQLRTGDVLARIGGDEFGVLLPGCDRATALAVTDRLRGVTSSPFMIDGELHPSSVSAGVALCPEHGVDLTGLLERADAAMYAAKSGRLGVVVHDPERHPGRPDRLNPRDALARHELVAVYQPQVDLATGRMTGVEALVRWQHPVRGLLFPDAFLPFFEEADLMAELTLRMLEIGTAQVRRWRSPSGPAAPIELDLSINLAPSALLRPDLVDSIGDILGAAGLDPATVTVEITENAMMADLDRSRRALDDLRRLGVRLSLDDYGTGYCSLTYLRDLPLDEVKIDRSFVMTLVPGSRDAAIVSSTVRLAHELDLTVVAEGVENRPGLDYLRRSGCDVGQGYLFSRPVGPEEVARCAVRGFPDLIAPALG
jgi:diguanylate cyclase